MRKATENRCVNRVVQVCIRQYDECTIAAKLEDSFLQAAPGDRANVTADFLGPGKRNNPRNWMFDECIAQLANVGNDHVQ